MDAMYAKYINETTINTEIPKIATVDGVMYSGDLTKRPDILNALGFYLVVEKREEPLPDGYYYGNPTYTKNDEDKTITAFYRAIPSGPAPVTAYSKVKILLAAESKGFVDALISFIESNKTIEYIWNASNIIENNELFKQYLPLVSQSLGKTESEVLSFLDEYCVAD
jgi:hypothetical protein